MAEANHSCRWDELRIGDQIIDREEGTVAYTIMSNPFTREGVVGYRAAKPGGVPEVVYLSDRGRVVTVRRQTL